MKTRIHLLLALILMMSGAGWTLAQQGPGSEAPGRPEGPCDIYAAANAPCVAAHSTTRALYAGYDGPLYQVLRQSDGRTLDIGVVQPMASPVADGGGYANAAAQDAFCANTYCWISTIYDQSPQHNDLIQAPRGGFSGPAMGGFNNLPLADMAPVTIMGHKAYGVFIEPGMGLRQNDAHGTAVDDQAQGQYWVINGHHYNSGCCFDYGNAETDSRDDGNGTMETTYFGNAGSWYHGPAPGPWIMTDQENNLVGCVNADASKLCPELPNIGWRFVTAVAKGEPHHWTSMGGDAQRGTLAVMFDGPRVNASYDPMRKQGAILLGNGGDNSNGSQGTFYEGAMTAPGTFPDDATDQLVQDNVVAAGYDVQRLSLAPATASTMPPGLQTFAPGTSQDTTVTFTNTTGAAVTDLTLGMTVPPRWTARVPGTMQQAVKIPGAVAPGASVSATFRVVSGPAAFNGDLLGTASWTNPVMAITSTEIVAEKVRNAGAVKINEFRASDGSVENPTNSFIELLNAGSSTVDISGWTLTQHAAQQPIFSTVKIPAGTRLAAGRFYLLGLATSGLAAAADAGDDTVFLRSVSGLSVGDAISIDTGAGMETRRIASVGTAAANATTLWQPLPDGPVISIPAGSKNVPVTSVAGFEVGQKIALGHGARFPSVADTVEQYEVATVTAVGKPGTQAWMTADARAGDTNIKVSSTANISVGDSIRLDIDSVGHGIETVTVTHVGTQSVRNAFNGPLSEADLGTGLELAAPLRFNHSSNIPFSAAGSGVSFEPATSVAHISNEPVQALGTGIRLDKPLDRNHPIDAAVRDAAVTVAGYQGKPVPDQWIGGPALSTSAGTMVLRDAAGLVVDSLNYGGVVDPWAAEGHQAISGSGQNGCHAPAPSSGRPRFGPAAQAATPDRSVGRYPDGLDADSNCTDFLTQVATTLAAPASLGTDNVKVASVADFAPGMSVMIDTGPAMETAVIASVGTAGATTLGVAARAGASEISVPGFATFAVGQPLVIGSGADQETVLVASVSRGPRGGGGFATTAMLASPLSSGHAADSLVAGTGITFTAALKKPHAGGVQVTDNLPTPGAPNRYFRSQ
jgi:hypothetical protein